MDIMVPAIYRLIDHHDEFLKPIANHVNKRLGSVADIREFWEFWGHLT